MARTSRGNQTGKAAQGHDDITDVESDYARRLKVASDQVKDIIGNTQDYIHLMLKIKEGEMLETFETIVAQCKEWDQVNQPVQMKHRMNELTPYVID